VSQRKVTVASEHAEEVLEAAGKTEEWQRAPKTFFEPGLWVPGQSNRTMGEKWGYFPLADDTSRTHGMA
jgi:hypothetical protein